MSYWKIIEPVGTTNLFENPSIETNTTGWSTAGVNTIARSSEQSFKGAYSLKSTYQNNTVMVVTQVDLTMPAAGTYTYSVRVYVPTAWGSGPEIFLDTAGFTGGSESEVSRWDSSSPHNEWVVLELEVTVDAGDLDGFFRVRISEAATADDSIYLDGFQLESGEYRTTYCDGDQEGCSWSGEHHASESSRSAVSRAGGYIWDLQDDLSFAVSGMVGAGVGPIALTVDDYAILPGGILNSAQSKSRQFSIVGTFRGSTQSNLHSLRQRLMKILSPFSYPKDSSGWQPIRLRYTGAAIDKEIGAHYRGGLEGSQRGRDPCYWESLSLMLLADNPYWYGIEDTAMTLDTNDSATFRVVAGRMHSTGQWDELGPPDAAGTYNHIGDIVVADDYTYFGGNFLNFDNIGADHIVSWDGSSWSALGTGMNAQVRVLLLAPDGTLYAGGDFTTAGGGAANYIASWDGSSWSALGAGTNGDVYALAWGLDGTLYVGGNFTTAGGGGANYIASWDGASWSALGTGMNSVVEALVIGLDGTLYAGGFFTTAGGGSANYIASWDGASWSALGTGMNTAVYALAITSSGVLYAGGLFTTAGGNTANYIASWNGAAWAGVGGGMNQTVWALDVGPDDMLYAGGFFTQAGSITLADRIAKWNGGSWAHLDINLPGAPYVYAVRAGHADPVISANYDIWTGFTTTGTGYLAGAVTVSNSGTAPAYPRLIIERSGGTTAILESLRNETAGQELLLDYDIQDGEILTIDLEPKAKSIVSSFFGARPNAILPNSNFGEWSLLPGSNLVTCFVNVAGAPTVTAYLLWQDAYESYD